MTIAQSQALRSSALTFGLCLARLRYLKQRPAPPRKSDSVGRRAQGILSTNCFLPDPSRPSADFVTRRAFLDNLN
jgi:hypothetical protein